MTADPTRSHPGREHAVVWPGGAALLSAEVSADAVEQIWHRMRRGGSLADFLEALAESQGASLLQLPPFAIVLGTSDSCHIAVRGEFEVNADSGGGRRSYTGIGVTTWFEGHLAPRPAHLVLMAGPVAAAGLPIVDGVVEAGALSVGEGALGEEHATDSSARPESQPLIASQAEVAAPPTGLPEPLIEADGAGELRGNAAAVGEDEVDARVVVEAEPELADSAVPHADPTPLVDVVARDDEAVGDEGIVGEVEPEEDLRLRETRYDDEHLAASIIDAVPVEMIPSQPSVESPADPGQDWIGPLLSDESMVMDAEAAAVRVDPRQGVPKSASAASEEVLPQRVSEASSASLVRGLSGNQSDLHDDYTVVDFDARDDAFLGDPSASALEEGGAAIGETPIVLASFCQRGHANPPQRGMCRVCEGPVEARTERTPRPPLGRIRLSSGEMIELTGSIVAGRSPRSAAAAEQEAPRLLTLPHPHVSGNHLEFTLEGWTVLVRDLGSRNGSYLRRDGQGAVPLPGRSVPLVDGDIIDLGHGVFLYLEQLP